MLGQIVGRALCVCICAWWMLAAAVSAAQAMSNQEKCLSDNRDLIIEGCTALIESGGLSGEPLSVAYDQRGTAYYDRQDYDRAIADYTQAIRLSPKDPVSFNNRGNAYNNQKKYDRALADFDKAIRLNPKSGNAYNGRGNAHAGKGNRDRAIADYTEAIKLDARHSRAFRNRGVVHGEKGDFRRALADLDEAIRIDPRYVDAFQERGRIYEREGDGERAKADFAEAERLKGPLTTAANRESQAAASGGADDTDDCDHGDVRQVRDLAINKIEEKSWGWEFDVEDPRDGWCTIDFLTLKKRPPDNCEAGGRVSATGKVDLDFVIALDVDEVECSRPTGAASGKARGSPAAAGPFAALAPNDELSAPVAWGKTEEEAKSNAMAACQKLSDSCARPAWTDDTAAELFASMCCSQPKHGCAVGVGTTVEAARRSVQSIFDEHGYSNCKAGNVVSAKTGLAVDEDDEDDDDDW